MDSLTPLRPLLLLALLEHLNKYSLVLKAPSHLDSLFPNPTTVECLGLRLKWRNSFSHALLNNILFHRNVRASESISNTRIETEVPASFKMINIPIL